MSERDECFEVILWTDKNYMHPNWAEYDSDMTPVHDWRGYISTDLRAAWDTFTKEQRRLIAENAQVIADREVWE